MVSPSNLMNSSSRATSSASCFDGRCNCTGLSIIIAIFETENGTKSVPYFSWVDISRGWERKIDEKSISILRYFGMEKNSYTRANCINSGGTLLPLETSFFRKPIPEILRKIGTFRFSDVRLHFFSFYRFYIFPGKMGSIHPFQKTKLSLFSQELRVPDAAE